MDETLVGLVALGFSPGETASAFPKSGWGYGELPPTGAPKGASVASATLDANGSAALTGLDADTEYFVHGGTSGRYVSLRSGPVSGTASGDLRLFNVRTARGIFLGAKGDDATDDYDAMQATIDEAEAFVAGSSTSRAAIVKLPVGVYRTRAMLKIRSPNIIVDCDGPGSPTGGADPSASPVYGGAVIRPTAAFTDPWVLKVGRDEADYALSGVFLYGLAIDGFLCTTLSGGYVTAGTVGGINWQVFNGGMEHVTVARVGGDGIYEEAIDHVTAFPKGAFDNRYIAVKTNKTGGYGFHSSGGASDCQHIACIHEYSSTHGMYFEGSGHQVLGCDIYNCLGNAINGTMRAQVIVGNRFIDCNGGVYLSGAASDGGGFVISGNQFRSLSYDSDGATDGINLTATGVIHGGTIGANSFSTLLRNGPANAMRWCINIASSNVQGVSIAEQSYDFVSPATRCYVTGKINIAGVGCTISGGVIAQSAVAASHTGDTSETALATITIPGGMLGPNGRLRVTTTWTLPNNANSKAMRVRFGGPSGTSYLNTSQTTAATYRAVVEIANRNNTASQVSGGTGGGQDGASSSSVVTSAVDTTIDQSIVIAGALGNAADTMTLESYMVEVVPS